MEKERIIVIDGNSLIYRAFFALPPLTTKEGIVTNGIYGFFSMYYKILDEYNPKYLAVVFDKKGSTFRHKEYEEYKAGRAKMPDELSIQFPIVKDILSALEVESLEIQNYEADDIAGTIAKMASLENKEVLLVSGDRDYLQLVDENTNVLFTKKGISEIVRYDIDKIYEEYEMTPNQLIDLKALMGDKSDNIPGVPGIGPKTGIKLIKEYGRIENIYLKLGEMKKSSVKTKLEENKQQAFMSKMLATIVTNVPLKNEIDDFKLEYVDPKKTLDLYKKYELKSFYEKLIGNLDNEDEIVEKIDFEIKNKKSELEEVLSNVENEIFIKLVKLEKIIIGASIFLEDRYIYIDLQRGELRLDYFVEKMKPILENRELKKFGYDIKEDIVTYLKNSVEVEGTNYDGYIAGYLIDPSVGSYSCSYLSRTYLKYDVKTLKEFLGTGKDKRKIENIDLTELAEYFIRELKVIVDTKNILESMLAERGMESLFYEVELPLTKVMADMEYQGFKVDIEELHRFKIELNKKIDIIKGEIFSISGEEFNMNSPKQLGVVLFEKLGLPAEKKTKTGYSTSVEVLDKLKGTHPIIDKILDYRQFSKLLSTYVEGLENIIVIETNKVHSKFNQTIAATGRISSTEPNLQNIPIRTQEGRKIRKFFIPKDKEYCLLDADYSQIELRVLAHITGDEKLIKAFKENYDIHRKTASEVFHVEENEVSSEMRGKAKAVNFGIIYGISDFGLARDLKISRSEAKKYIDSYLENYPKVKKYMEDIVIYGKKNGFVETILKRRRYIPELQSRNFNIRNFGERIAMNTPIQGSAADIIKVAMINIYNELKIRNLKSKLILQVHDELILETHVEEIDIVKDLLKETMENAVDLKVPLKIDMEMGNSWYETK